MKHDKPQKMPQRFPSAQNYLPYSQKHLQSAQRYLQYAGDLAVKANPSPNPRVGAVIVKNKKIIAFGYHRQAGKAHAEIIALRKAGNKTKDAILYVTLEPCCHYGKTPPCIEAIIKSGIKKVVIAMKDPNPLVAGKGIAALRSSRLFVNVVPITSSAAKRARADNKHWIKRITIGIPYVTLKVAQSLDGKICTFTGDSKWITSPESRKYAHQLRASHDAILVGIGTVLADDPQLSVRLGKNNIYDTNHTKNTNNPNKTNHTNNPNKTNHTNNPHKINNIDNNIRKKDRQPLRVILDRALKIPLHANVLRDSNVFVCTVPGANALKKAQLQAKGIPLMEFAELKIRSVLEELGRREINSVLIEGGTGIYTSALEEQVVDKVFCFIAPKLIGGNALSMFGGKGIPQVANALPLQNVSIRQFGDDVLVEGELESSYDRRE